MEAVLNLSNVRTAYERAKEDGDEHFNCWGATLFSLGAVEELYWVEGREMIEWLDENTIVIEKENIQRGDILVLWKSESREYLDYPLVHTAIYLGHGRFFHKRGSNRAEITSEAKVKKCYWEGEYSEIRRYVKS